MRTGTTQHFSGILSQMGIPGLNPIVTMDTKPQPAPKPYVKPRVCFSESMKAYHLHVGIFNRSVKEENKATKRYNEIVAANQAMNPPNKKLQNELALFSKENASLSNNVAYNELVFCFNARCGMQLKKRKLTTVKPSTQIYFKAFMYEYQRILSKLDKSALSGSTATKLPKLYLNPLNIIEQEIEGHQHLDVCKRTIRNHRNRLEECGILLNYKSHGRYRPIECQINLRVLQLVDDFNPKSQNAQNQIDKSKIRKELPQPLVSTRTYKSTNKSKGNVDNIPVNNRPATEDTDFYKNTKQAKHEKTNVNKQTGAQILSEKFKESIEDRWELSKKLANGEFDNHQPINLQKFTSIVNSGLLNDAEFRDLWMQDIFKTSAKIYIGVNVFAGNWHNAMTKWHDEMLKTFTGLIFDQRTLLNYTLEYQSRIKTAIRCEKTYTKKRIDQGKTKWMPLPSDYFHPSRKDANGSFGYTKTFYDKNQSKKAKNAEKVKSEAAKYKRIAADQKKFNTACNKYVKKTISLQELLQYVKQNVPRYTDRMADKVDYLNLKALGMA